MAYIKKDFQQLYEAMADDLRERLPGITDFEEGSVIRSIIETIAYEQAVFYKQLDYIYDSSFINTAQGLNLEKVVAILGIQRNEPDYALGKVTFFKEADFPDEVSIPIGTLVVTEDNPDEDPERKAYKTIEGGIISIDEESLTIKVQADARGRQMETKKDTIIVLPAPVQGVEKITNTEAVDFVGRDRETDEELRTRAKNVLLAAGRASETSIEQALMAMPHVLDVKVKEGENKDKGGIIYVYVDGLQDDNSKAIRARLDEVRAAGIYPILGPADKMDFEAIIKLLPHEDVLAEETTVLEDAVKDAVKKYLRLKKMGDSISINQLFTEVLNVKGVKDIADYQIELRDHTIDDETKAPAGIQGIELPDKEKVKVFHGYDDNGNKVYTVPDTRNIVFTDSHRFFPSLIRVAAGDKNMPIQFQIKVDYPNVASAQEIVSRVGAKLDDIKFTKEELVSPEIDVSEVVITLYLAAVEHFWNNSKQKLLDEIETLRIDPLGDEDVEFFDWVKNKKFPLTIAAENLEDGKYFIEDSEITDKFLELAKRMDGNKPYMKKILIGQLKDILTLASDNFQDGISGSQIGANLLMASTKDLQTQLNPINYEIASLTQEIALLQFKKVEETDPAEEAKTQLLIDTAKDTLKNKLTKQVALQDQINNIMTILESLMQKWGEAAKEKVLGIVSKPSVLNSFANGLVKSEDINRKLRIRAFNFEQKEYFDMPIPLSFIEKPVFDYLWVHNRNLRIMGKLKLSLPATLSEADKSEVYDKVLHAINLVIYNLRPEADIEIEKLIDAAKNQQHVLAAEFVKDSLKLIEEQVEDKFMNDKEFSEDEKQNRLSDYFIEEAITDKVITVNTSEKVLLSDYLFFIEG